MADYKIIAHYFLADAFNTGQLGPADDYLAPNFRNHDPGTPPLPTGPVGFKQLISGYRAAFPDAEVVAHDWVIAGDKVVVRFTFKGTHQGELMGIPPTGKAFAVSGLTILRFANGQCVERWSQTDFLDILQQVGAIPTPA